MVNAVDCRVNDGNMRGIEHDEGTVIGIKACSAAREERLP